MSIDKVFECDDPAKLKLLLELFKAEREASKLELEMIKAQIRHTENAMQRSEMYSRAAQMRLDELAAKNKT